MVGSLRAPLDFRSLAGQTQYLQAVQQQYKELQASWLTPVEIFQPHYGRAKAACILQRWRQLQQQQLSLAAAAAAGGGGVQHEQQQQLPLRPLRIFEIGGGTGTLARNILVRFFLLLPLLLLLLLLLPAQQLLSLPPAQQLLSLPPAQQLLLLPLFRVLGPMPASASIGFRRKHVLLPLLDCCNCCCLCRCPCHTGLAAGGAPRCLPALPVQLHRDQPPAGVPSAAKGGGGGRPRRRLQRAAA